MLILRPIITIGCCRGADVSLRHCCHSRPAGSNCCPSVSLADGELLVTLLAGYSAGITTSSEVVAILEAHPWVRRVYLGGSRTDARIFWQWNGQEPDFARQLVSGFPNSYIYLYNNVVRYIRLSTRIPYGEVRSLLGAPVPGTFLPTTPNSFNALYFHTAGYLGGSVVFATNVSCPATPAGFWNDPVVITYNDGSYVSLSAMPPYNLIPWVSSSDCTE